MTYKNLFKKEAWLQGFSFGFGILSVAIILGIIGVIFYLSKGDRVADFNKYLFNPSMAASMTPVESHFICESLKKGTIVAPQDIISQTVGFYDTLISFLLGVIALTGILSFVYFQSKRNGEMRTLLQDEFKNFTEKTEFKTALDSTMAQHFSRISEMEEQVSEWEQKLSDFRDGIEKKMDHSKWEEKLKELKAEIENSIDGKIDFRLTEFSQLKKDILDNEDVKIPPPEEKAVELEKKDDTVESKQEPKKGE